MTKEVGKFKFRVEMQGYSKGRLIVKALLLRENKKGLVIQLEREFLQRESYALRLKLRDSLHRLEGNISRLQRSVILEFAL